jgi:hypothetical protein
MTTFYCLRFETPSTWRARSMYFHPPGKGWSGYIPRHWVPFSSPPTTSRLRWRYSTPPPHGILSSKSQSQCHIVTDGRSVSKSWCYCLTVTVLILWGVLSDEGTGVFCKCCWPSPAKSFSDPCPLGLATVFYCISFETSLFVASYDSQGHGGGTCIGPRLHTSH